MFFFFFVINRKILSDAIWFWFYLLVIFIRILVLQFFTFLTESE